MLFRRARAAALLLVLCSLLCAGCIEAQIRVVVKYEPKDDSFRLMQAYNNIRIRDKKDFDHLKAVWGRRGSIIINPVEINLGSALSFERKGKHKYSVIDLASPSVKSPAVHTTAADLDSVKVMPGQFFLSPHGTLCCYQQVVVPGKVIDAALKEAAPLLSEGVGELGEKYARAAATGKAKVLTWEEVRKEMLERLAAKDKPRPAPKKDDGESLPPLDATSLRMLRKAAADKAIQFTRKRDQFFLLVPLSDRDAREAAATVSAVRDAVEKRVKAGKPVEEGIPEILQALSFRQVKGAGLEVAVDGPKLVHAVKGGPDYRPDEKKKADYQKTITSVQGLGIPINKALTLKKVIAEFIGK